MSPAESSGSREPLHLLAIAAVAAGASAVGPHDRFTWWLEVGPVLIIAPLMVVTARWFPLTPLLYRLALLGGEGAEDFLGTQGDEWDTQWDMSLALTGAIAAQLLLSRPHDRDLRRL